MLRDIGKYIPYPAPQNNDSSTITTSIYPYVLPRDFHTLCNESRGGIKGGYFEE